MVDIISIVNTSLNTIMYLIVGCLVLLILFVFFYLSKFKHTIILKYLANDRKIIKKTKWREFQDKEGVPFLQTLKKVAGRRLHPLPPPQCIELQHTGKQWVEGYVTETGEIHYLIDNGLKDGQANLEAFTTKQRSILINQYKKALERKGKNWQELILPVVGIGALVIIVVCLFIFYGNIAEPVLKMGDKMVSYEKEKTAQIEMWERMESDIQQIKGELNIKANNPPD